MRVPAWKSLPEPKPNSRWDAPGINRTVRVMGVAEGYVMCRRSGAMPYVVHMSDWHKTYVEKPIAPRRSAAILPQQRETP